MNLCEIQGHFYPVDSTACAECGREHDCDVDGHVPPPDGFNARCLMCGEVLDPRER